MGDYVYHKVSPFAGQVNDHLEMVQKQSRKEVYLMDSASHELLADPKGGGLLKLMHMNGTKAGLSDGQQYIKLFITGLPLLMQLSSPGLRVFVWILSHIKPKQDHIILIPNKVSKEIGYAVNKPVHDGINDLLRRGVIARKYTGTRNAPGYWINPTIFFNGNRRHLFNETLKKERDTPFQAIKGKSLNGNPV